MRLMTPIALLVLLATGIAPPLRAQETEVAKKIAQALTLEEGEGRIAEAAAAWRQAMDHEDASAAEQVTAGCGLVRCLLVLGRQEEAKHMLARVRQLATDDPALIKRYQAVVSLVGGAPAGGVAGADPLLARVVELVGRNDENTLRSLGEAAIPALREILMSDDPGVRQLLYKAGQNNRVNIQSTVLNTLIAMGTAPARAVVMDAARDGRIQSPASVLDRVQGPEWAPLGRLFLDHEQDAVRQRAWNLVAISPDTDAETWRRLIADPSAEMRKYVFRVMHVAPSLSAELRAEILTRLMKDPFVDVRLIALANLDTLRTIDYDRMIRLRREATRDPDPKMRVAALQALSELPKDDLRVLALQALADEATIVRSMGLQLLHGDVREVDAPRLRALLDSEVREGAIGLMTKSLDAAVLCDGPAAEALFARLLENPQGLVRSAALSVLARAGSEEVAPLILPCTRSRAPSDVVAALFYLQRHDRVEDQDAIIAAVGVVGKHNHTASFMGHCDPRFASRYRNPLSLHWIVDRHPDAALDLLARDDEFPLPRQRGFSIPHLVAAAFPVSRRGDVLKALGRVESHPHLAQAIEALEDYLGDDPAARRFYAEQLKSENPDLRRECAKALAKHGTATEVPALIDALSSGSPASLDDIVRAIAAHAEAAHVPALMSAVRTTDGEIQVGAVTALSNIGGDAGGAALLDLLDMPQGPRALILEELGKARVPEARTRITTLLEGDELTPPERTAALLALGGLGEIEAVDVIIAVTRRHEDRHVDPRFSFTNREGTQYSIKQHAGVIALFDLGWEALDRGWDALGDDETIAANIVRTLAFTRDPKSEVQLDTLLQYGTPAIRAVAAQTVGQAGLVAARPHLVDLLRDPDDNVRSAAETALRRFVDLGLDD